MYRDDDCYFSRNSLVREIFGQKHISDAIGMRALVIQALQGLGVEGLKTSRLFEDPTGRLRKTAKAMETFYFGPKAEAEKVAAGVRRAHSCAHGVITNHSGNIPDGTTWDANDPDEQRWVIAAVIDSAISVYGDFCTPLSAAQRDQFVREYQIISRMLEAPGFHSYAQLQHYMNAMYSTFNRTDIPPAQRLELTEETRSNVVKAIFSPQNELLAALKEHVAPVIKGVLPPIVRRMYEIKYSHEEDVSFQRSRSFMKGLVYHTRNGMIIAPYLYNTSPMAALADYATPGPKYYRRAN